MGIAGGSFSGNGNNVGRNLGIEWKMGMLVWEWHGMGIWSPLLFTFSRNFACLLMTDGHLFAGGDRGLHADVVPR